MIVSRKAEILNQIKRLENDLKFYESQIGLGSPPHVYVQKRDEILAELVQLRRELAEL